MTEEEIRKEVRTFVCNDLFNGQSPADFTDDTALITSRLMDSISTLHMINHFEDLFFIAFEAHEVSVENLDTINIMVRFLSEKIHA